MVIVEYLKVLGRRWRLLLACVLVAAVAGYVFSPDEAEEEAGSGYEASLTLIPSSEGTSSVNLHLAAHLATTPDVANIAAENLPAGIEPSGSGAITAGVSSEAGSLTITATDQDETRAGMLVRAYADATIDFFKQTTVESEDETLEELEEELDEIEESIAQLESELEVDPDNQVLQARLDAEIARYSDVFQHVQDLLDEEEPEAPLEVVGTAQVSELDTGFSPPSDRRARAGLAGALGLVLGLGLALTVDRMDSRLREREDVEDSFGLPVLSEVPRISRRTRAENALVTVTQPDGAVAEAYRSLRSAITLVAQGRRVRDDAAPNRTPYEVPKVLVVTGAQGDEGKSTTVVNLAAALAETGRSVLVIDCDFRKPEVHHYLNPEPGVGLADLVEANVPGNLDLVSRATSVHRVHLVTSGDSVRQPAAALSRLSGIVAEARDRADVVVVDTSPLLVTSDAQDVLRYADGVLTVCRFARTTYEHAIRARRLLERADVPLLGVVLTGTAPHRGTPYGQPSRRQAAWFKLTRWLKLSGPDDLDSPQHARPRRRTPIVPEDVATKRHADATYQGLTWDEEKQSTRRTDSRAAR
ncbi:MAG: division plane positioning ATPase MipZ [Guyparkeria sp.]